MRRRCFAIKIDGAILYILRLLAAGVTFEVRPCTDRVDISTPFDLAPDLWPDREWML